MEPQLPTIDKAEADKKFKFAFRSFLAALGLTIVFLMAGLFVPKLDFRMVCAIGSFLSLLVAMYAAIVMLIIKITVYCHEELEKLEKRAEDNM
ncbi:MAG: hypothetical protein Q8R29_00390 [bacterium]|nr:hypothetical protein [bacterium]